MLRAGVYCLEDQTGKPIQHIVCLWRFLLFACLYYACLYHKVTAKTVPCLRIGLAHSMTTKKRLATKQTQDREDSQHGPEWSTTAVHFPTRTLQLLKLVAFTRAQRDGGRISVSKVLTEIIESHRSELERELQS